MHVVSGSVRPRSGNLVPERTSFVGRADDLARIARAFDDGARLVTLVGPPGIGKTRLALEGESIVAVEPLECEDAIALFQERARAVRGSSVDEESERPVVEQVVMRLDGIPLAVELAAAQAAVLAPEKILERIVEDRL